MPTSPGHIALWMPGSLCLPGVITFLRSLQRLSLSESFGVRIAGAEVLQHNQRVGAAWVLDRAPLRLAAAAVTNNSSSVSSPNRIIEGVDNRRLPNVP